MEDQAGKKIKGVFLTAFLMFALYPENCLAWGAGIHITNGLFVLANLSSLKPAIASVISAYPYDYLYGCISADIFIGKGYKRRDDHCHNWSVALKMFSDVETDSQRAFMYGYLSHLAADVIAHNYFIPNQLYITPTSRRVGHVYWEVRSDVFVDPETWKVAMRVIQKHNKRNDRFMKKAIKKTLFPFFAKRRVYYRSIKINNVKMWRKTFAAVSNYSKWEVEQDYIFHLNHYSLNLVMDFLKAPDKALCLKYDPVGTDNMIAAKKMRRNEKRNSGNKPVNKIFQIPAEIEELSVIDTNNFHDFKTAKMLSRIHL